MATKFKAGDIVEYIDDGSIYILVKEINSVGYWKIAVVQETHIDIMTNRPSTWKGGLTPGLLRGCKKIGHVDPRTLGVDHE